MAEGTIFRHYKTKKELLFGIVSPIITKFAMPFFAQHFVKQVFEEEANGYEEFLRRLIHNRFEFVKENVTMLKIVLQEVAFHEEMQERFKSVFQENVLPPFEEMVKHFQEKGQIKDYPTHSVVRLTISTVIGFMVTRFLIMPDFDWDDEKEIDRTIDFIMNGLET